MSSYFISTIANWNCDPIIESLTRQGNHVILVTIRRPSKIPKSVSKIYIPIFSTLLFILWVLTNRIIKKEMYTSYFWCFILFVFDLEASVFLLFNKNIEAIIGWGSCSKYLFSLARKLNIFTVLYMGSSHILQQDKIHREKSDWHILPFIIKRNIIEYAMADRIIIESDYCKKTFINNGVNSRKLFRLNVPLNDNDIELTKSRRKFNSDIVKVAFLGDREFKGIPEFIATVKLSQKEAPNQFDFYWFGMSERLKKKYNKDLSNINIVPRICHSEFIEKIASCQVLLLPTFDDGGPRVLSEALSLGLFCIGFEYCKLPEFVKTGFALIANPTSESLLEKLTFYYSNREKFKLSGFQSNIANSLNQEQFDLSLKNALLQ